MPTESSLLLLLLLALQGERTCSIRSGSIPKPPAKSAPSAGESQLLHHAVAEGDADLVNALIADGAELEARDQSGFTPLTYAAFNGDFEMVMLLCALGASPSTVDGCGTNPLHWAVLHGHSLCAYALLQADRDLANAGACMTTGGTTPLMLASAADDTEMVEALLAAGVDVDEAGAFGLTALHLATAFGHADVASMLRAHGATERPITPPAIAPPPAPVRIVTAEELASPEGAALWRRAFDESEPLYVRGLGKEWSEPLCRLSPDELSARWGEQEVAVCFSPDPNYQTHTSASPPSSDEAAWRLRETPTIRMPFAEFVARLPRHGADEYFAVQQSPSTSLDEFAGLPSIPPLLERLMRRRPRTEDVADASQEDDAPAPPPPPPAPPPLPAAAPIPGLQCNLWVCRPPKRSQLHFDHQDSVLLQMQGTKRFTLVDPRPLDGLVTYPSRLPVARLARRAEGEYEYEWGGDGEQQRATRTYDNFPLANVTHPDLAAMPLMAFARVATVDVHEGDALVLPAYWYHQVESHSPGTGGDADGVQLNVAVNYWWSTGAAPATLHGALRERVRANLTPPT